MGDLEEAIDNEQKQFLLGGGVQPQQNQAISH